jgi:anti-sigma factor RsiW
MKKECEFYDDKLLEYACGELTPGLEKKVSEHTAICVDCWKKVDGYKKASQVAASAMKVDFSDEIWEMQRREIIKRVTYRVNIWKELVKFLVKSFSTRKLAAGFALFILLAAGGAAGFKYFQHEKVLEAQMTITNKIDMFENMAIIERLDFYTKMSDRKAL